MNTYVCPICGERYAKASAMANCATKCAAALEKRNAEREAQLRKEEISKKEAEILKCYKQLTNHINEYKQLGGEVDYNAALNIKKGSVFQKKEGNCGEWIGTTSSWFDLPKEMKIEIQPSKGRVFPSNKERVYSSNKREDSLEDWLREMLDGSEGKTPNKEKLTNEQKKKYEELANTIDNVIESILKNIG